MEDYRQNPPTVEDINTHLLFTVWRNILDSTLTLYLEGMCLAGLI